MKSIARHTLFRRFGVMSTVAVILLTYAKPLHAESPGEAFLLQYYETRETWPDSFKGPYPVIPGVYYKGEFRKLVGVEVNRPYFIMNGLKRFIHSSAEITFLPTSDFYNISARLVVEEDFALEKGEFLSLFRPATQWVQVPLLEGGVRRALTVEFDLKPDRDLEKGFAAVVFHDDQFKSEIYWSQLATLKADENRRIKVVTDPIPRDNRFPHNFIVIFTPNGEVVTQRRLEISESLAALSFQWMQNFVSNYVDLNSDNALPVLPIHQGAVSFLTVEGKFLSGSVRVQAVVDRYGFPRNTRVVTISNELLAASAIPMVQRWLFFPKLYGGEAVETEVAIPINYLLRNSRRSGR